MSYRARLLLTFALVVALASTAAACTTDSSRPAVVSGAAGSRPNIVLVLTDDLSMNLLQYLPHVQDMARNGTSFANYTVTDSLCCPSRSSLFTGMLPHDTGVFTNGGIDGGYGAFHGRGDDKSTYATTLQQAGYRTAMMGKYLNGYDPKTNGVPPGWNEWDVAGNGYGEFNYDLNENGTIKHYGKAPEDYLVDVMAGKAAQFVTDTAAAHTPFAIELATFAPHGPYTPAPRDADAFPGLTAPRGPAVRHPAVVGAAVARVPHTVDGQGKEGHRQGVPQARAGRAVGGQDDRHGPGRAGQGRRARQHGHRVHLGQRLSHGGVPADPRQADGVRHRRARAAGGRRTRYPHAASR